MGETSTESANTILIDADASGNESKPLKYFDLTEERNFPLGKEGFNYGDLYDVDRLRQLAELFYKEVSSTDPKLWNDWLPYLEAEGKEYSRKIESDLIVRMAPHLGRFLAGLFCIEGKFEALYKRAEREKTVIQLKNFVQRRAFKKISPKDLESINFNELHQQIGALKKACFPDQFWEIDEEFAVAKTAVELIELEKAYADYFSPKKIDLSQSVKARVDKLIESIKRAPLLKFIFEKISDAELDQNETKFELIKQALSLFETWLFAQYHLADRRENVKDWISYRHPEPLDYAQLVQINRPRKDQFSELITGPEERQRLRDGFKLTDPRYDGKQTAAEVDYCIYCHEREKDSCSKGFVEKDHSYKKNPLGISLEGCPLDEKISEAHILKRDGHTLASLAVIMIDNPMLPGTGHRICNDCMKSCIFQKQEPVNIPQIETGILTDILYLPYGFEIYSLLTRWNPLNVRRPYTLPYNGKKVLVVGLGPAGYTLAHYLTNEGFGVVGIDGLKIESMPDDLVGNGKIPRAVRDFKELYTELDRRRLLGFGGVSEYGITVRWDKNFLTVIYLSLLRRSHFHNYSGVRFGGTINIDDAWDYGFDHIAIAAGAGRPTIIPMKNNLIRGIKKASDFLMALQLSGAYKRDAMANLQMQLPAIVIGGGLTAIDTATEMMAYYPVQVEKMLERYERLTKSMGEEKFWSVFDEEERGIFKTFIEHGEAVRAEREHARRDDRQPDFVSLIRNWGGVSIVYRKGLVDSPAYRLNHEEVIKALEEGISFIENLSPVEAMPDQYGAVSAIRFERLRREENGNDSDKYIVLPAKSVCVAAGTSPNIVYEKEHPGTFKLDKRREYFASFKAVRDPENGFDLVPADLEEGGFFTSYHNRGRHITYYGDNHPVYAGNVVKAMASAKHGYRQIRDLFARELISVDQAGQEKREEEFRTLIRRLDDELNAVVVRVDRLTPTIVEVVIRAPAAARKFSPGQFYRLQTFESDAPVIEGTRLIMEGIALTGAWVDPEHGWLSLIVLEMGVSSRLCAALKPGQKVVVMGPTGAPTEIPKGETVLLAGGGLGNAVLFSIVRALKSHGNRTIYFAGYKKREDLFKRKDIEAVTDQVVWSVDIGEKIEPRRPQDLSFQGNIVQAIAAYGNGELGEIIFPLCSIDRIIAIGSDRMMAAVKNARKSVLAEQLKQDHIAIGSINSPMQCMMKEVCAQCLQKHVDPNTGAETQPVFSCFNQDQKLDEVDFKNLNDRLRANTVQEKLANLWLDYLLAKHPLEMV